MCVCECATEAHKSVPLKWPLSKHSLSVRLCKKLTKVITGRVDQQQGQLQQHFSNDTDDWCRKKTFSSISAGNNGNIHFVVHITTMC